MASRVFISYSSEDGETANRICDLLEGYGVRCWMAPRDIPPGANWDEEIVRAITDAAGLVLVLSEHANQSRHVRSEVERAFHHDRLICPVRIADVEPSSALEYFTSRTQWVDAWDRPQAQAIEELARAIRASRRGGGKEDAPTFQALPIVDRLAERERLQRLGEEVSRDSRGLVVMVEGPAGVGKTRLLEWCADELAPALDVRVVWGKHTGWDVPWEGVRQALEELFGVVDAARCVVDERVRERLRAWGGVDEEEAVILAHMIRPTGGVSVGGLDAEGTRVLECLGRVLRRFAREEPLAIFLEDVHWADAQSVSFIEYVAASLEHRAAPLFFVAALRTEDLPSNEPLVNALGRLTRYAGRTFERIQLRSMDDADARELVDEVLPGARALSAAVAKCAQGCPLYILETLRHLHANALVERVGGLWRVAPGVDLTREIPGSLRGLIQDRVTSVTAERPGLDTLLAYAAALGAEFPLALLERALQLGEEQDALRGFDEGMEALEEAGLLRLSFEGPRCLVWFSHNLVYRTIYDAGLGTLHSRMVSRRIHRSAARSKEEFYADSIEEYAAGIAENYELAQEPDRAASHYLTAAGLSASAFCYADALRLYGRAWGCQSDCASAIKTLLSELPPVGSPQFAAHASKALRWCVPVVCGGRRSAGDLLDRVLPVLGTGLSSPARALLTAEAEQVFTFLIYVAQDQALAGLWADITKVGEFLVGAGEVRNDLLAQARVLDHIGFAGESLANETGTANSGAQYALQGARRYEQAAQASLETPDEALRVLEAASWCYRRAGEYEKALECTRKLVYMLDSCSEELSRVRDDLAAEAYRDMAETMMRLERASPQGCDMVRQAAEGLRRAALQRFARYANSWFARWTNGLAAQLERESECDFIVPVDATPADALLIHNRYDALAADLVRECLERQGQSCVSTGPDDPRSPEELERAYRLVVVFGSTVAPRMQRFAYLFQGEPMVWKLNTSVDSLKGFGSWWRRPKAVGQGEWIMVAGSTKIRTILAADLFRREYSA